MTPPLDPEELKIPAFKRKRSLNARAKHPLAWTARDRQKAALEKEGSRTNSTSRGFGTERRAKPDIVATRNVFGNTQPSSYNRIQPPSMDLAGDIGSIIPDEVSSVKSTARNARNVKRVLAVVPRDVHSSSFQRISLEQPSFLDQRVMPIVDHSASVMPRRYVLVGEVTAVLQKISVACVKVSSILKLGEVLLFQSEGVMFEEKIEEMQINRKSVKTARKSAEVGIKMKEVPKNGTSVWRVA